MFDFSEYEVFPFRSPTEEEYKAIQNKLINKFGTTPFGTKATLVVCCMLLIACLIPFITASNVLSMGIFGGLSVLICIGLISTICKLRKNNKLKSALSTNINMQVCSCSIQEYYYNTKKEYSTITFASDDTNCIAHGEVLKEDPIIGAPCFLVKVVCEAFGKNPEAYFVFTPNMLKPENFNK